MQHLGLLGTILQPRQNMRIALHTVHWKGQDKTAHGTAVPAILACHPARLQRPAATVRMPRVHHILKHTMDDKRTCLA